MAVFTKIKEVLLPEVTFAYKSDSVDYATQKAYQENKTTLVDIKKNYGVTIKKWATAFELPEQFMISFIATESGGKNTGKNGAGAIGLMQVKEISVRECVSRFKKYTGKDLPVEAVKTITSKAKYLNNLTANSQDLSATDTRSLESTLAVDEDFNIMLGSLCFRVCLDYTKANGVAMLNKAIIAYNQGFFGDIKRYENKAVESKVLVFDKSIPKETRSYIVKNLGVNGFLQIFAKEKL